MACLAVLMAALLVSWVTVARGEEALPAGANAMCPVMEDQPTKASRFVDFQGKRIYFCCDKCVARFQKEPQKYLAKLTGFKAQQPLATGAAPAIAKTDSIAQTVAPAPTTAPSSIEVSGASVAQSTKPFAGKGWQLLGKFHVVVVHFPIALILLAGLIELLRLRRAAAPPGDVARACLTLGALGAVVAAFAGWVDAAHVDFANSAMKTLALHRWLGVSLAAASMVAAIMGMSARRWPKPRVVKLYRWSTVLCALLVAVVGHFGGTLTYGPDYYTSIFHQPAAMPPPPPMVMATEGPIGKPTTQPSLATDMELRALMFGTPDEVRMTRIKMRLAMVPKPARPPEVKGPAANPIDRFIVGQWEKAKLDAAERPPELCDDATFCRRVYLDLIGVVPTIAESQKFIDDKSGDKRAKLIDDLLNRTDAYAAHWTPFWEEAIASTPFAIQGGIPTHGNYQDWILESFKVNRPYDVMVAQLIDPTEPGYQRKLPSRVIDVDRQPGYIQNDSHVKTLQSASNVGQFFLGTEMKCASCHSHFLNDEWPQQRFLGFAGLFSQKDLEQIRCEQQSGKFIPAHFAFDLPDAPTEAPKSLDERLHLATRLITDPANPRFAKTAVNRLWKRYLGLGLIEPADDFRLDSPAANPELLDWLAYDFIEHGYDVKHTIRLILNSRTYQLKYDPKLEDHFDVAKRNEPRYYRSPTLRRLTAEQLVDSIRVAANQKLDDAARLYHTVQSTALTRTLGRPALRNEITTSRSEDVAVVQSLELLNGQEWYNLIYSSPTLLDMSKEKEQAKVVDALYRAALSRSPTTQEVAATLDFINKSPASPTTAPTTQEVVWIDDDLPAGAQPAGSAGAGSWQFVTKPNPVFSGTKSRVQESNRMVQHYALGTPPITLESGEDVLYAYVYMDPANPPKELLLQFNSAGSWEHRGYWGMNSLTMGTDGSESRKRIGELPKPGEWVRLEVVAKQMGLSKGSEINGFSFDQFGGKAYWDKAGVVKKPMVDNPALGDVLWVLFTSPEFQYIR
jgi:uncharacterized membrane protein/YHS domain-containing protein